eukprot:m.255544 g.255544  ORF g.255544 m.255544 type:complete len:312 (+) comp19556_c0_seq1:33-968(+)
MGPLIDIVAISAILAEIMGTSSVAAAGVTSFALSTLIYLSSGILSRAIGWTYYELDMKDQQRWNSGITRGAQGCILGTLGLSALLAGVPQGDLVFGSSDFLMHAAAYALGFFLFETRDSLNMFLAHGIMEETLLQHHLLGIVLYASTLYFQAYVYLAVAILIQEFAAPFTHIGWMLAKCSMDLHWSWALNQYVLIIVWIVDRSLIDILLAFEIGWSLLVPPHRFLDGPAFPMLFCLGGFAMLSVYLNPYWLRLKFRQLDRRNRRYRRRLDNKGTRAPAAGPDAAQDTASVDGAQADAGPEPGAAGLHPHAD